MGSVPDVYGGLLDKIPFGAAFQKGLTFKTGQTHVQKYLRPLLKSTVPGSNRATPVARPARPRATRRRSKNRSCRKNPRLFPRPIRLMLIEESPTPGSPCPRASPVSFSFIAECGFRLARNEAWRPVDKFN